MEELGKPTGRSRDAAPKLTDVASELVEKHGSRILRIARRYSDSSADADDAYQRALEKILTKAPTDDIERLIGWAMTVVRNEALMIRRRERSRKTMSLEDGAPIVGSDVDGPGELVLEREQLDHGREALGRMHPDQARCLLLRADGLGYPEICEITGFSYPKVNRCLTEGRKAFSKQVSAIATGSECERLLPELSRLADGAVDPKSRLELRKHLKHCGCCRATVREFRAAPRRVAAAFPIGMAALDRSRELFGRLGDSLGSAFVGMQQRMTGMSTGTHSGMEMAFAKKAALVTITSATIVTGGVGVRHVVIESTNDRGPIDTQVVEKSLPTDFIKQADNSPEGHIDESSESKSRPPRDARAADAAGPDRLIEDPASDTASPSGASVQDPEDIYAPPDIETFDGPASSGSPRVPADLAP